MVWDSDFLDWLEQQPVGVIMTLYDLWRQAPNPQARLTGFSAYYQVAKPRKNAITTKDINQFKAYLDAKYPNQRAKP